MSCNQDKLLALARGELRGRNGDDEANQVETHAASCDSCADELAWLRAEGALFRARRGTPLPSHAWQGIERRVVVDAERRAGRRRAWVSRGAVVAFAAAAAGVMWFAARGNLLRKGDSQGEVSSLDGSTANAPGSSALPSPQVERASRVLDQAEAQYKNAILTLEVEWAGERARMAPEEAERRDAELVPLRQAVEEVGTVPAVDLHARRRALRAYSAYMRTMQAVVLEGERQ